jgi:hypothetical protein
MIKPEKQCKLPTKQLNHYLTASSHVKNSQYIFDVITEKLDWQSQSLSSILNLFNFFKYLYFWKGVPEPVGKKITV